MLSYRLCSLLCLLVLAVPSRRLTGQSPEVARTFSIFLDCTDVECDGDFYRTDIAFADHVRDRTAADVHVLITSQRMGGGGRAYTLAFYGQRMFAGVSDTLQVELPQGATDDEERRSIARTVKLGLARYVARTPASANAMLTLSAPAQNARKAVVTDDPWNAWVFRLGANGNGSVERNFSRKNVNGSVSANRVTAQWKTNIRVNENYQDQAFTIDGKTTTIVTRNFGGSALQVKSLGEHWSAGLRGGAGSSTFLNQQLAADVAAAVEYDLYPYSESTRRQLRVQYALGGRHFRYTDTTIFLKTRESRPYHSLTVAFEQKETWGSVNGQWDGYHLLDDLSKSQLNYRLGADIRIIKGLSLNFFGVYSVLHDQLYLAKEKLNRDGVLLRQSQQATTYRAFLFGGISYTFGSLFNNIVNPRFGDGDRERF